MQDIKCLSELLQHNKEVLVIDLLDHVTSLEEDPYLTSLVDPEPGIYVVGSIEPFIPGNRTYYPRSKYPNPELKFKTFEELLDSNEDIVDSNGSLIVTAKTLKIKRKYLKLKPTVPSIAAKVAIGVVLNYLNSLCRHTHVNNFNYRLEKLVLSDKYEMVYKEEYEAAFERLLDQVQEFIGKDTWNMYFYKVRGSSLIVEKSCDIRIYEWYQAKFEKEQEESVDNDIEWEIVDGYKVSKF